MIRHEIPELHRDLAQLGRVRADDAVLQGPADRRPQLQRRHPSDDLREALGQQLFESRLESFARLDVVGHDNGLGEEGVGQLDVQGQIEADGALTDVAAPALDLGREVGILAQDLLEFIH